MGNGSGASPTAGYEAEWNSCRESSARFDGYLLDLRKYGFSLLTALTAGGSFLGFASPSQILQIGVIIVTMILVVVLYWVDVYYQNLLYGSIMRGRFLELFRLDRGLANWISFLAGTRNLSNTLHFLYGGFITGLLFLGMIVIFNAHCDKIILDAVTLDLNSAAWQTTSCFVGSIVKVPVITALLGIAFGVTIASVHRIYRKYEKDRMGIVRGLAERFEVKYREFQNLPYYQKKTKTDEFEREIQTMFLGRKYEEINTDNKNKTDKSVSK